MENIKDKIQKLLNLATSDNEHEAAAALKKATDLMNKWNLDEQTVRGQKIELRTMDFPFFSWTFVLKLLVQTLCQVTDLHIMFQNGSKKYGSISRLYISGRPRDIDNFDYLFNFLKSKMIKESEKYKKSIRKSGTSIRNNTATESFRIGFIDGIGEKLIVNKSNFFSENKGLVSIDSEVKRKEAADFMHEEFKDDKTIKKAKTIVKSINVNHTEAGKVTANEIDLNVAVHGKKQGRIGHGR